MRYLSVCSGIEAATVAWHELGWTPVAFSEIEPFPSALLAHHYPDVPNWGDMTKFKEWPDACVCVRSGSIGRGQGDGTNLTGTLPAANNGAGSCGSDHSRGTVCEKCGGTIIDVLVGGTPCQSFSVAGLRKGMADPRGNLALTFLAIADKYRPQWILWENVPGVLSSHGGRDFAAFLGGLGQLGYGWAYRVLDAQYMRTRQFSRAVPQRRRRVFVVGCLGNWAAAAATVFDATCLRGDPAPCRKTSETITGSLASRASSGGGFSTDFECAGGLVPEVMATLDAMMDQKFGSNQWVDSGQWVLSSGQANASIDKDVAPPLDCLHEAPLVIHEQ